MKTRPRPQPPNSTDHADRSVWNCLGDVAVLFLLFIAPLFLGGRHPLGRLVFVSAVFLLALTWSLASWRGHENKITVSWSFLVPLLGIVLCVVQLMQLPPSLLNRLSPQLKTLLSAGTDGSTFSIGSWRTISLSPVDSRESLCVYLAYVVLFLVMVQRLKTPTDVRRLVSWIACATIALASIGIVQYLIPNGRFLWIYAHPTRETFAAATGPFVNANHFAHMMAMGLGPAVWLVIQQTKTSHRRSNLRRDLPKYFALAGVCIVLLAGLLSYSRAGIGLLGMVLVCLGFYVIRFGRQGKTRLVYLAIPLILSCAALAIHGIHSVVGEVSSLALIAENDFGERKTLWKAVGSGIKNFVLLGSGAGSHREVYPAFMDRQLDRDFTHAENGYLQVFMETGIVGFLALVGSVLIVSRWSVQCVKHYKSDERLLAIAISLAIGVSLLHSLCDFVWYIPACATWLIFMLAILYRLYQWTDVKVPTGVALAKPSFAFIVGLPILLGALSFKILMPPTLASRHWEDYLTLSIASNQRHMRTSKTGRQREIDKASFDSKATVRSMLESLEQVVELHPTHARAHSRLASLYLQTFDLAQRNSNDPMGVTQIRDAAYASKFASRKQLYSWLSVALGDNLALLEKANSHARRSIQNCPMQGLSYLYLSELSFLTSPNSGLPRTCIQQAHQVRPTNGAVLFAVGQIAASEGRVEDAFAHWKNAFQLGGIYQQKVVEIFAPQLDAKSFIEQFSPDLDGLQQLYSKYEVLGRNHQNQVVSEQVARHIHARLENEAMSHDELVDLGLKLRTVKQYDAASDLYQLAYVRAPYNFQTRWRLAKSLFDAERYDEAFSHLNWCKKHRPNDEFIGQVLRTVIAKTSLDGRAL